MGSLVVKYQKMFTDESKFATLRLQSAAWDVNVIVKL